MNLFFDTSRHRSDPVFGDEHLYSGYDRDGGLNMADGLNYHPGMTFQNRSKYLMGLQRSSMFQTRTICSECFFNCEKALRDDTDQSLVYTVAYNTEIS